MNGKRYDNTRDIGVVEFIVSTSEEDHKFSNRYAEVIELPIGYSGPISIGDTLLVHHNAFKYYNDMRGRQKSGKSFFKDDLFFIDTDQFFMYKKGNTWNAYDKYCEFMAPRRCVSESKFKELWNVLFQHVQMRPNCDIPGKCHICYFHLVK
jgi:hypothetical protein